MERLVLNVLSSIIHHSPYLEAIQMSFNRMDTQCCSCTIESKKAVRLNECKDMGESWHNTEEKKPTPKNTNCRCLFMMSSKTGEINLWCSKSLVTCCKKAGLNELDRVFWCWECLIFWSVCWWHDYAHFVKKNWSLYLGICAVCTFLVYMLYPYKMFILKIGIRHWNAALKYCFHKLKYCWSLK